MIAGVRSLEKAEKLGLSDGAVQVTKMDVTSDPGTLSKAIGDADVVVCATSFVPGNPFKMSAAAHAVRLVLCVSPGNMSDPIDPSVQVDNEGTIHLVDAAKSAGVKKFVLVSSILTNGRGWGQVSCLFKPLMECFHAPVASIH